jgi:hypothetical protein
MKMKHKGILQVSLIFTLILSQLFSCGESTIANPDKTDDTETSIDTKAAEYIKPNVDYGGDTFTIASYNLSFNYPISKYTLISHSEETGDIINDSIVSMTRMVEDELNVNLEFFELVNADRNNVDKITKFIYAGEDAIQAAFPFTIALSKLLAVPSMLTDLELIETLDMTHSWWDQKSIAEYNIGGKLYAATGDICFFLKGAPIVNVFNKKIIEDLSLDNPYQLVYDGKWTIDKMISMAKTAAADLNGNQTPDLEDRYGFVCEAFTLPFTMIGSGIRFSQRDKDDNVTLNIYNSRSVSVVEKMVPFMREKTTTLYARDYQPEYPDPFESIFVPAFMENRELFFCNQLLLALDFRKMDADFGILPIPKLDENQEEYYSVMSTWWSDNLVVPVTNQRLDMTGHILDAMGYYSQQLITPAFIDTTVLGKSVRDEDSAQMIRMIYDTQVYDIAILFDWGGIMTMLSNLVQESSINLASAYATNESAIKTAMQKTMDELLNNK